LAHSLSGRQRRFPYGQEAVEQALRSSRRVPAQTAAGKLVVKRVGTAISYRFVRDAKGWLVFVSVAAPAVPVTTVRLAGAIGFDINADHLALAETDRFGNLIETQRLDLITYGKTTDQAKALMGDVVAKIATLARQAGKPVVVEQLDFSRKKAELEAVNRRKARMLSSFSYNKILSGLKAACFREGVEVITVNPAYTSVIGAVNHAQQKGISVHQGAAYAVARRGLRLSERPTVREAVVPTRNGGHVTFALPVRNRAKHVWSFWSRVRSSLKAAHVRRGDHKTAPPPLTSRDGTGLGDSGLLRRDPGARIASLTVRLTSYPTHLFKGGIFG
jgi:IS605 OrfB family transposase